MPKTVGKGHITTKILLAPIPAIPGHIRAILWALLLGALIGGFGVWKLTGRAVYVPGASIIRPAKVKIITKIIPGPERIKIVTVTKPVEHIINHTVPSSVSSSIHAGKTKITSVNRWALTPLRKGDLVSTLNYDTGEGNAYLKQDKFNAGLDMRPWIGVGFVAESGGAMAYPVAVGGVDVDFLRIKKMRVGVHSNMWIGQHAGGLIAIRVSW